MAQFSEILTNHGIQSAGHGQHHHARHGWVQFDCPFCSPGSGRFRMGFNLTAGYCNCWVCGPHSVVEVVQTISGLTYSEVKTLLEGLTPTRTVTTSPRRGSVVLPKGVGDLHPVHRDYLAARGFDVPQMRSLWNIQGITIASRLSWRIFIPAYMGSELVSWTTRAITDNTTAKYISASVEEEAVSLKELLYGEHYCRHCVIVNEGPLDAWAIGPGAVATCGVTYSRSQLLRMTKYPVRVIVFDNEPDAQRRATRLCADLSVFPGETYNVVLDAKDASRSSKKEIQKLREKFLK